MSNDLKDIFLYHGSGALVKNPDLSKCANRRDFGRSFYLTYNKGVAKDWSKKVGLSEKIVNKFALTLINCPETLKIKKFSANEEWARFVYDNRYNENYRRPDYDILIGPIADNGLAEIFSEVDEGLIDFPVAAQKIAYKRYKDLQYAFCSKKALNLLKWIGRE